MKTAVKTSTVICTGAPACRMTKCVHFKPHEKTSLCEGGCIDGGVCVEAGNDR